MRGGMLVLSNFKVGHKLLSIVVLVGFLLGIQLLISFFSFLELRHGLNDVKNEAVPNAILSKDMQMQVVQMQQWLTDISATRGQDGLDDGFKKAEEAHKAFLEDLEKIRTSYEANRNATGLAQVDQLKERMDEWYVVGKVMAQSYIEGGASVGNKMMGQFDNVSTQLQAALDPIINSRVENASHATELAVTEAQKVQLTTLAGIVIAVLVLGIGGHFLARGVSRPINRMSELMAQIVAHKDFSVQLDINGNDEIATASRSFNSLIVMLRTMLQELNHDVHRLDNTAESLSQAISHSSHSASTTSESASAMAAAVEQMSVSLDRMRDNTHDAQATVTTSTNLAEDGSRVIGESIKDMQVITTTVQQVAEVIGSLGKQTGQITNIVNVISEVAEQTNLLALNAAIEAARAGELGRGFAVVADEVRKLAERTAKATGEIGMVLNAVQERAQTAVSCMDKVVQQVNSGCQQTDIAGQSITVIRDGALQVAGAFRDIANAIDEQSSAGQLIAQQVEQVARASDENSGAVERTAQSAQELELLSREIRARIDQFKIKT